MDRFTGYRYYSGSQLPRLNRILALKDLGLALDQIAQLLQSDLPVGHIRGMLQLKQVEIEQQMEDTRGRLARVEWGLKRIEQEETMTTQEVVLKPIPAMIVASVRDTIPSYGEIGQLCGEIFGYLGRHRVSPAGPAIGIYYDEEYRKVDVDVEAAVPVNGSVPAEGRVDIREIPAVDSMVCIVHTGSFDTLGATYSHLMGWIEANGYQICGPCREVYIQ